MPSHDIGPRGPFVSPGSYTVTLAAGDAQSSQTVVVRGDPQMPHITDAMHREREQFLLEVAALQRRVAQLAEGVEEDDARTTRINQLRRRIGGLAGDFNGSGVRPGTMHPPTATQRRVLGELEQAVAELEGS